MQSRSVLNPIRIRTHVLPSVQVRFMFFSLLAVGSICLYQLPFSGSSSFLCAYVHILFWIFLLLYDVSSTCVLLFRLAYSRRLCLLAILRCRSSSVIETPERTT
jgi:hypothetical protein